MTPLLLVSPLAYARPLAADWSSADWSSLKDGLDAWAALDFESPFGVSAGDASGTLFRWESRNFSLDATRMADQARKAGPLIVTEIPHPYWFGEKRNAKTQDLMAGAKAAEGSGRYAEALRLYEAAYLLTERTGYLLRLADMRALLGHHTIAAALYHRVASDKYSHPSEREEAAEKIERLALDEEQLRTISGGARPKPAAAAPAAAKPGLLRKLSFSRDRKGSTSAAAAPAAAPPANGSAAAAPPKVGALRRTLSFGSGSKGQGSGRRASAGDAGRTTAPIGGGRTALPLGSHRSAAAKVAACFSPGLSSCRSSGARVGRGGVCGGGAGGV